MERTKVVVLRDFSYTERAGEEELASERFLSAAPPHISLSVQPPKFKLEEKFIRSADVLISFGLKMYPTEVLDWVLEHPRHIHVEQDWWEPTQPNADYRNRIIENSAMVMFLSQLHRSRYEKIYELGLNLARCISYPLLESDLAKPSITPDADAAVLWFAPWHPDYGNDLMIMWAKKTGQRVDASGLSVPMGEITQNVKGIGKISLDVAPPSICAYSRFIYFPRKPIPFGFTAFLAYLHGLEVTYSGEIGFMSWLDRSSSLEDLIGFGLNAANSFWKTVEEVAA